MLKTYLKRADFLALPAGSLGQLLKKGPVVLLDDEGGFLGGISAEPAPVDDFDYELD